MRYSNVPGLEKPLQPLQVWYTGAYAQDEWRPRRDLTVTAGLRMDVSVFENTAYRNAKADALTFRDRGRHADSILRRADAGSEAALVAPHGRNWDVGGHGRTQVRWARASSPGPRSMCGSRTSSAIRACSSARFWSTIRTRFRSTTNPDRYKPTNVTGAGAASFELNVTDPDFKFPQVWRTNFAVDQRLPGGFTGTLEFLYNKDITGIYYINANLPAAQTSFSGPTTDRMDGEPHQQHAPEFITSAFVLKNQASARRGTSLGASRRRCGAASRSGRLQLRRGQEHHRSGLDGRSTFANNQISFDPNNPGLGYSRHSQGHRVFVQASYTKQYFGFGATTISGFWEAKPSFQNFASNGQLRVHRRHERRWLHRATTSFTSRGTAAR